MGLALSKTFDKYEAYAKSVQASRNEAKLVRLLYRNLNGSEPTTLREDFCGTFAMCCEWVKFDASKQAIGLDIDPEPLEYGKENYLPKLNESARNRILTLERDVLARPSPQADIIAAFNFSYFAFHSRATLLRYFKTCRQALHRNGLMMVDTFGGSQHCEPSLDVRRLPGLTYYFEQEHFDPISNRTRFSLHYKPKNGRIRKRAFTYDWRMWSIPEIRDTMLDAGFSQVEVYWEGTGRDGRGSGRFHRRERGEPCDVWVAYVVGRR